MEPGPAAGRRPDPQQSLAQYRRRAARYDAELAPFDSYRREAIAQLGLQPGQHVIDVGCGTGLSFSGLLERIGAGGRIVALDPSPDMLALARERVQRNHWTNVDLLQAGAAQARLRGRADAALFHFTHDVLRDAGALDHVLAHVKPGGRVVATGLQWAPPWLAPTNVFVWMAAVYSVSSLEGLQRPWDLLAARLVEVSVQTALLGGIYVAAGRLPPAH
jgi:demethylmenaquinone methyltransferase/2-methoxy-6-polyprenyl-1,4-benzoquinol methylase